MADPTAIPRYRGLSGAAAYGLILFCLSAVLGAAGWLYVRKVTGNAEVAGQMFRGILVFGATCALGVTLARWICGGTANRLMEMKLVRGDLGAGLLLVGIGIAGATATADAGDAVIGQPFKLEGPTLQGGTFKIEDCRGKVVLVDFWATWCGPCIQELPNIRNAYDDFRKEGLEVVSVSLDDERASLERFLKRQPMPWPQVFFDEEGKRGWDNPIAKRLGIKGIPALYLIDKDGNLAAQNLRGGQIPHMVAQVLGKPRSYGEIFLDRLSAAGLSFVRALMEAPWWLAIGYGLAGAFIGAILERFVRSAFGKRRV